MSKLRVLGRWETGLVALLAIITIYGQLNNPALLGIYNLQTVSLNNTVLALLALGVAPVIITADIDISVASNLALCGVVMAKLYNAGVNIWVASALAVLLGGFLGLVNGLTIVLLDLPALAVTLGTMGAYTGVAFLILQGNAISDFPAGLFTLGGGDLPGSQIPISLVVVIALAAVLGFFVHKTAYGRALFAIGANRQAALFSGVPVVRVRILAYVIAGLFAGLAAVFYLGNYETAMANIASDQLLPAITAVILGGVSAYGGTGTIPGVMVAVVLLALLQSTLGLAGVSGQAQTIAVGALLIFAIGAGNGFNAYSRRRRPRAIQPAAERLGSGEAGA